MMKRRNCTLNESDIELFHFLYSAQQEKWPESPYLKR